MHFDGMSIPIKAGQSLAAALTAAGQRTFRETSKGSSRGIFCGMGICQDCLVTVDGAPNQRACMTLAHDGMQVSTQVALAPLMDAPPLDRAPPSRQISPDVLVIGGGIGGLNAAIAAAQAGAQVVLLDERKVPGGQYLKQSAVADEPLDVQQAEGQKLVSAARAAGVEMTGGVEVWGAFDGLLFLAEHQGGALVIRPRKVIVATGAYERPRMTPGWTLPGVMTTGAAQTLWRSYRTLPGKRVAIFGTGPLNIQVALELAQGGAEVAAVGEAASKPTRNIASGIALIKANATLALKGVMMLAGLRHRRIPIHYEANLVGVEQVDGRLAVTYRDSSGTHQTIVDALCMNDGFEPQNEILRLLGAEMAYDQDFGHLRCRRGETMETTVEGLYAVGDCAGLGGAPAAAVEGRIAGRAAAASCRDEALGDISGLHAQLRRHRAFQSALWRMHSPAPRTLTEALDETIVCRCEEVTLGELRQSLTDKPGHAGTMKRATRAGMGRCQGRYCGPVVARLVAEETGQPLRDHSYFAPRVPIKPISIAAILAAQEALDGQI
ncbi:2Fe-2S iron-sulfur cluster-binding protein [Microvirga pudoricolor]|uniref:2Fe-2S iron-sulfur cluster-binding protein n=1 Tax=Microvirga pudoricolor TaxID=2778729 RepID=UPI0019517E3D|nr:2Fe-2S iron-sulfur cluster-binding protein [Microvirga pudoricolor]MBM6596680.1 (2Fe-2S)-binding protein [Microvirga pudoricolor]